MEKEELRTKAKEHLKYINEQYKNEILKSKLRSYVFDYNNASQEDIESFMKNEKTNFKQQIFITPQVVLNCLFDFALESLDDTFGILNFSSYTECGGKFLEGYNAQEEHLCHVSTLYPVLQSFKDSYYNVNTFSKNNGLYSDRGIYCKDVIFESCVNRNFRYFIKACDVVTLPAPNYKRYSSSKVYNEEEYLKVLRKRISSVLLEFYINGRENIILGAYGCGVFGNNPSIVGRIFFELLNTTFKDKFRFIYFPIPDVNSINYKTFKSEKNLIFKK